MGCEEVVDIHQLEITTVALLIHFFLFFQSLPSVIVLGATVFSDLKQRTLVVLCIVCIRICSYVNLH